MNRYPKEANITPESVRALVRLIVKDAEALKDKHVPEARHASVN